MFSHALLSKLKFAWKSRTVLDGIVDSVKPIFYSCEYVDQPSVSTRSSR